MKKVFALLVVFQLFFICLMAQNPIPPVDKSPMDMSYYPVNYPVLKIQKKTTEPVIARVVYSRPQRAGRNIFGGLVKCEVWRMGANEATELEFFKNVRIGGKKINKGRYSLFAIVNENSWTIIINKETDTWGSFAYDQKKDVVRHVVTTQRIVDTAVESLGMGFEKTLQGFNLVIAWENTRVSVPFTL
jgi:hypothetical protein